MRREARGMLRLGLAFDTVMTSPLVRARETAEIIAGEPGLARRVEASQALAPGSVLAPLDGLQDNERVLLVGHAPDLGQLAAGLIGAAAALEMGRGALCGLNVAAWGPGHRGHLLFLLPAEVLVALGHD